MEKEEEEEEEEQQQQRRRQQQQQQCQSIKNLINFEAHACLIQSRLRFKTPTKHM